MQGLQLSGKATPHDTVVSGVLAWVMTGGDTDPTEPLTEHDLLELELQGITALMRLVPTLDRMEHMLTTSKPLRN